MSIEKLEMMQKYFYPSDELKPDDFEEIISNSRFFSRFDSEINRRMYNTLDYTSFYMSCKDIAEGNMHYYFSARYRCVKYIIKNAEHYLDFSKDLFNPQGDEKNHTVKIGKYFFCTQSPKDYNCLILLLKWSDQKFLTGEFPVNNEINVKPLLITQSNQLKYGLCVDLSSNVPCCSGYCESCILDKYHVECSAIKGGVSFFIGGHDYKSLSISEYATLKYKVFAPTACYMYFSSPVVSGINSAHSSDFERIRAKDFRIFCNEEELTLFVFEKSYKDEYIHRFRFISAADYFRSAAWFVITLTYGAYDLEKDVFSSIYKYWPTCPLLPDSYLSKDSPAIIEDQKQINILNAIKDAYVEFDNALIGLDTIEYDPSLRALHHLLRSECLSLICSLAPDKFEKNGLHLANRILDDAYLNDVLKRKDKLSRLFDKESIIITSILHSDSTCNGFQSWKNPFIKLLLEFYKQLGDAYMGLVADYNNRDRFYGWIQSQNKMLDDTFDATNIKQALNTPAYESSTISVLTTTTQHVEIQDGTSMSNAKETRQSVKLDELNELVGLDSVKKDVVNLIGLANMQQLRKRQGLKPVPVSLHLVFTGNPGTGKTSVARILAQLYKEIGVLKTGQLIEVDRSDLVAGYVGQTALKTQERIKEAMGGVLFIDEAYTLSKDGNDFGQEAIDTLIKAMEDNRDEFVVIVAGYNDPMQRFLRSNQGLRSRFNKFIDFPDYSSDELVEIFKRIILKYDYSINEDAFKAVSKIILDLKEKKGDAFANARDVRNLFEQIVTRQAIRIGSLSSPTKEELLEIRLEDI